jgi:hypothetical protein
MSSKIFFAQFMCITSFDKKNTEKGITSCITSYNTAVMGDTSAFHIYFPFKWVVTIHNYHIHLLINFCYWLVDDNWCSNLYVCVNVCVCDANDDDSVVFDNFLYAFDYINWQMTSLSATMACKLFFPYSI